MRPTAIVLAASLVVLAGLNAGAARDDFKPLVQGDDPAQFRLVDIGPETITVKDGEVRLTGKPNGYFATKDEYKNYTLSFEWMYERPDGLESDDKFHGNSGLLLHIQPPQKVWPRSIEFQLMNQEVGKIYPIAGAKFQGKWDGAAFRKAIKPVGQWNLEEVTSRDGMMTCTLNGVEVTRGQHADPDHGAIGFQSEGSPIRFKNLKIKVSD